MYDKGNVPAELSGHIMSISDVSRWSSLSNSTVRRAVRNGKLRVCFYTPGGHARFLRTDVASFIESTTRFATVDSHALPRATGLPVNGAK